MTEQERMLKKAQDEQEAMLKQQKMAAANMKMKSAVINPKGGISDGSTKTEIKAPVDTAPDTANASGASVAGTASAAQGVVSMASQKASGSAGADIATGALGGAATGASIGSAGGPWGAAIGAGVGAVVGGVAGGLKSKAERDAQLREIEAEKLKSLGQIENDKQQRVAAALQNMGASLNNTFNNNSGFVRI